MSHEALVAAIRAAEEKMTGDSHGFCQSAHLPEAYRNEDAQAALAAAGYSLHQADWWRAEPGRWALIVRDGEMANIILHRPAAGSR